MKSYKVVMTPDAKSDMRNIRDYIAETFSAPDTARNYIHSIRDEVSKLKNMASVIAPVPEEPWHSKKSDESQQRATSYTIESMNLMIWYTS